MLHVCQFMLCMDCESEIKIYYYYYYYNNLLPSNILSYFCMVHMSHDHGTRQAGLLLLLPIVVQGSVQRRIVAHWRSGQEE